MVLFVIQKRNQFNLWSYCPIVTNSGSDFATLVTAADQGKVTAANEKVKKTLVVICSCFLSNCFSNKLFFDQLFFD